MPKQHGFKLHTPEERAKTVKKHNDTKDRLKQKLAKKQGGRKICLIMIVKNESRIIQRCLTAAKPVIQMVSICDTGSTDETVNRITEWCTSNEMPFKVHFEPFQDFGYNRTMSCKLAQETFPEAHYGILLDADMVLKPTEEFKPELLIYDKYLVSQVEGSLAYDNIRLINLKRKWECIGVTHEYWDLDESDALKGCSHSRITTMHIDDISDGGCRADKYERDVRLLLGGLENPKTKPGLRGRYMFYLAQTYRDMGRNEDAVQWYRKRIEDKYNCWVEEYFHSLYQIGSNYEKLGWKVKEAIKIVKKAKHNDAEIKYMNEYARTDDGTRLMNERELEDKAQRMFVSAATEYLAAFKYRPGRAESLYNCCRMYRQLSMNEEAYHLAVKGNQIPMTSDTLFVETNCYKYLFDHELSIVASYVPGKKPEGREAIIRLMHGADIPEDIRKKAEENSKFYL